MPTTILRNTTGLTKGESEHSYEVLYLCNTPCSALAALTSLPACATPFSSPTASDGLAALQPFVTLPDQPHYTERSIHLNVTNSFDLFSTSPFFPFDLLQNPPNRCIIHRDCTVRLRTSVRLSSDPWEVHGSAQLRTKDSKTRSQ